MIFKQIKEIFGWFFTYIIRKLIVNKQMNMCGIICCLTIIFIFNFFNINAFNTSSLKNEQKNKFLISQLKNMDNFLSTDIFPLDYQAAGHVYQPSEIEAGILKYKDEYILKLTNKSRNDNLEIQFYEAIQTKRNPLYQELKEFVPKYYGVKNLLLNEKIVNCLVLENVLKDNIEPCIMDIKIGKITWQSSAPFEKILRKKIKYKKSKEAVGFYVPGFEVRNISDSKLYKYGRDYAETLDGEKIKEAFKIFLNATSKLKRPLLLQFLSKLLRILHWYQNNYNIRLYSSSIFLTYDASLLRQYVENIKINDRFEKYTPNLQNYNFRVDVKMIDFAHAEIGEYDSLDENYLEGIQSLVKIFQEFLNE